MYITYGKRERPLRIYISHYQFVLGAPGGTAATVENLVYLKSLLPENATWSAFEIGKGHMAILYASLAIGGHIKCWNGR
jgi:3-keto-5-aminohexanoate cleavage enzyme